MLRLNEINESLSEIYESYKSKNGIKIHAIAIPDWEYIDYEIPKVLFKKPVFEEASLEKPIKFKIEYKSLPIGKVMYWVLVPDDETLLIIINDFDEGGIHLVCNDFLYLQYALTHFVFSDRQGFNENSIYYDIGYEKTNKGLYVDLFIEEMKAFYLETHSTELE